MGILGRLSTLIKSNVNDAIDSMQDPGKGIDQMVRDMEDYARQARAEVARCIADERLLERRQKAIEGEIADWQKKAEMAIRAGDDGLAKEALVRKGEKETERDDTKKALQEQGVYGDQLTAALKALEARLKDVKARQGTLKAEAGLDDELAGRTTASIAAERRLDKMASDSAADDALAELKRKLGK